MEYLDSKGTPVRTAVFVNTYEAEPETVRLGAVKYLGARSLKEGEFTFRLNDESGKLIGEAANQDNGAIVFPEILYRETGTYRYRISEAGGDAEGIRYDDAVFYVTVTVKDDREGHLTAETEWSAEPVFRNIYTGPEETGPAYGSDEGTAGADAAGVSEETEAQISQTGGTATGDAADLFPYAAGGIAGAAALTVLIAVGVTRKRRSG